jgi:hypothetical protein
MSERRSPRFSGKESVSPPETKKKLVRISSTISSDSSTGKYRTDEHGLNRSGDNLTSSFGATTNERARKQLGLTPHEHTEEDTRNLSELRKLRKHGIKHENGNFSWCDTLGNCFYGALKNLGLAKGTRKRNKKHHKLNKSYKKNHNKLQKHQNKKHSKTHKHKKQ